MERGVTAEWRDPEDFRSELPSANHRGEVDEAFRAGTNGRADEVIELARTKYGTRQQILLKIDREQWRTELTGA
jgi:hypothetical protein